MISLQDDTAPELRILRQFKIRDVAALNWLYDKYAPSLYNIITRLTANVSLSGRLLEQSFVSIWRSIDNYDVCKGRLFSWLLRITLNYCNSVLCLPKAELMKRVLAVNTAPG